MLHKTENPRDADAVDKTQTSWTCVGSGAVSEFGLELACFIPWSLLSEIKSLLR